MTELFRTVTGSRLFGTAHADSDTDIKAVHVPDAREILLGNTTDVVTSNEDDDFTSFPIQKYVHLLTKMETNAIEMLFASNQLQSKTWQMLYRNRFKLLNRNKKAFTAYGKSQAMRYAVRGERYSSLKELVRRLEMLHPRFSVWDQSKETAYDDIPGVKVTWRNQPGGSKLPFISAFGRMVCMTVHADEAVKVFQKPLNETGKRTRNSADTDGVDWKGLYHAQRIVDEGLELFSTGKLVFPCKNSYYYRSIRNGEVLLDNALSQFEESLHELEQLEPISDFPEEPDRDWAEDFTVMVHKHKIEEEYG